MKESERLIQECNDIADKLNQCMIENGWKARYLGFCGEFTRKYSKCRVDLFKQQRLEHVQETLNKRKPKTA